MLKVRSRPGSICQHVPHVFFCRLLHLAFFSIHVHTLITPFQLSVTSVSFLLT